MYYSNIPKFQAEQLERKLEISKFIVRYPKHSVVKKLKLANETNDRKNFLKFLTKIKKHLYAEKSIRTMQENCKNYCIDCASEIERLQDDLLRGR